MKFSVDFNSDIPLYVQLRDQIVIAIAKGELKTGEQLPPVRKLAEDIKINMHTVNKAYLVLRDEGFLTVDRRNGARVSGDIERSEEEVAKDFSERVLPLAAEARCRGLGRKDFRRICADVYETLKED